jgi:protein TonB
MMSEQKYKSLDDLVFEHRNREYGAFDMRMKENSTLMKAFLIGTFTCLFLLGFALSYNTIFKNKEKVETVVDINLQDVSQPELPPEEVPPPPPPPEKQPEPEVATVKVVMPEPKPEPKVEETVPEIKEMDNKLLGLENKEGKETNSIKSINKPTEPAAKPAPVGNFTARQVSQMAVYPGCEKFAGNKTKLQQCLAQKLNDELQDQLSDFAETMSDRGETTAIAKLQFVIDKSGRIIQVQAVKGSQVDLGRESEKALERIATRLSSRGKTIQPAKLEDGSPVNLVFQLPVKFYLQN